MISINADSRIMLFNLSIGGHYPSYIYHLINYWRQQALPGALDIVVPPKFLEAHADVVDLATSYSPKTINFITLSEAEVDRLASDRSGISRNFRRVQEWRLLCQYAATLKATHCLVMIIDNFQLALAMGILAPCPVSGIYFRPSLHYVNFAGYAPTWKEKVQRVRERITLSRVLRYPQLRNLFCLDAFAIGYIKQEFPSHVSLFPLPDPVQIFESSASELLALKTKLAIEPGRYVFLLLGELSGRRGIFEVLEAVSLLPAELCQKLCLAFVGKAEAADRLKMESQIADIERSQPVQIIRNYEFIPVDQVNGYYRLADVILTTHQRHIGMSSSLVLAATFQKPVLSSNYGLMGQIVQKHGLGLTIDSTVPSEIAQGLTRFLSDSPEAFCDDHQMKAFAEQNTAERFAEIILEHLG